MAPASSSMVPPFTTYPMAPAESMSRTVLGSSDQVSATTLVLGESDRIDRVLGESSTTRTRTGPSISEPRVMVGRDVLVPKWRESGGVHNAARAERGSPGTPVERGGGVPALPSPGRMAGTGGQGETDR